MPAVAFDTHAYIKKLRDAGVPEAQAEIQIEAIVEVLEKRMATKEDLELHKVEIQRDIKGLERDIKELGTKLERDVKELDAKLERAVAELKRDIKELDVKLETRLKELEMGFKELEMRLLIRLGGLLVVGIGAIATLIKLL